MKKIFLLLGASLLVLPACKPTENNYREAYDVAKAKAERTAGDLVSEGIVGVDAPVMRVVGTDTIYMKSIYLKVESTQDTLKAFNIVVGEYKMPTNAKAGVAMLKEKGFDSFLANSMGGKWYIVAGVADTLPEAIKFTNNFRKAFPNYAYIGLQNHPIIIRH